MKRKKTTVEMNCSGDTKLIDAQVPSSDADVHQTLMEKEILYTVEIFF